MPKGNPIPNKVSHDLDNSTSTITVTRRDGSTHDILISIYLWPAFSDLHFYVGPVHKSRRDKFYARTVIDGKMHYLHRLMLGNLLTADLPEADHIDPNGDTLDCRLTALRPATRTMQQNNRIRSKKEKTDD